MGEAKKAATACPNAPGGFAGRRISGRDARRNYFKLMRLNCHKTARKALFIVRLFLVILACELAVNGFLKRPSRNEEECYYNGGSHD